MRRFKENLKARNIELTEEEIHMVASIARRKLGHKALYGAVSKDIQDILVSNVLIVSAVDLLRRTDKDKGDIIISNLDSAIKLVLQDAREGSTEVALGD